MDRIEYGLLLVRLEELNESVAIMRHSLALSSQMTKELGAALEKRADTVAFVNAPIEFLEQEVDVDRAVEGSDQSFGIAKTMFDWDSVDVRNIAPQIIKLNNVLNELADVKHKIDEMKRIGSPLR